MYTVLDSSDGQKTCPKHVKFYSKNKFEKLVHLVGFIIRIRPEKINLVHGVFTVLLVIRKQRDVLGPYVIQPQYY